MSELRKAAQQALDALEWNYRTDLHNIAACEQWVSMLTETVAALRAALAEPDLDHCPKCGGPADNGHDRCIPPNPYFCSKCMAEPEQEPVASLMTNIQSGDQEVVWNDDGFDRAFWHETPLYTAPTPRKPLTDEEIVDIWAGVSMGYDDEINIIELARAIEKAHGIGDSNV